MSITMCKKSQSSESIIKGSAPSIHFALVVHKEPDAYNRDKNLNNVFQTIKGRFSKYDFTRSFEDDFTSILSSIEIIDKDAYNKENKHFVDFLNETKALDLFSEREYEILKKRAFPFNIIALKCLVVISGSLAPNAIPSNYFTINDFDKIDYLKSDSIVSEDLYRHAYEYRYEHMRDRIRADITESVEIMKSALENTQG